jgi:hypothetical protein
LNCKICGAESTPVFKGFILNKYEVQYFHCGQCGFTQTEKPYWLDEAYSDAISVSDTGIMARNSSLSKTAKVIFSLLKKTDGKFLDFGAGYGIFTRMMRDYGFDFYWYDKFATNLVARGFEGEVEGSIKYEAITSFENFEHLLDPLEDIEKMMSLSDTIFFSTELMPKNLPEPGKWWYYCLEHGQHISIFSRESLEYIAKKNGFNFISNGVNLHLFSKQIISPNIFFKSKFILKLGLDKFFKYTSKTNDDMLLMIKKMETK